MPAPDLTVKTYDPKMVVITFGVIPISGYAEGTFVSVNRSGDAFVKSKGAGGDVERINKNQGDFEVTVTLQQTATVNAELSAALAADQVTNAVNGFLINLLESVLIVIVVLMFSYGFRGGMIHLYNASGTEFA